jgi:hypothetical protein
MYYKLLLTILCTMVDPDRMFSSFSCIMIHDNNIIIIIIIGSCNLYDAFYGKGDIGKMETNNF